MRFRAAARTPRGHRSCSALSALEMRRRLQRCYCSSQNEAFAPLIGERFTFSAVAATLCRRCRRERRGLGGSLFGAISVSFNFMMSARHCIISPFICFFATKEFRVTADTVKADGNFICSQKNKTRRSYFLKAKLISLKPCSSLRKLR